MNTPSTLSKNEPKTQEPTQEADAVEVEKAKQAIEKIQNVRSAIGEVIFGQESVVEQVLVTILSGGHGLLVGVPGLAKTKLVETLGTVLGLSANRVQFTPDLMPSDILGSEVLDQNEDGTRSFRFVKGPIFSQLLMADEINRASPRTQSALLQSMQEYHVTLAGKNYALPKPFHVLATQNPLEQEGTYPLPEAQLDRFLMQIDVDYPSLDAERKILFETTGTKEVAAKTICTVNELQEIQTLVRQMPVGESVVNAILQLVRSARPNLSDIDANAHIAWGPGPRASQALILAVRARALIEGRFAPSIDDVKSLAVPILQHRMSLNFAARAEGISLHDVINSLVKSLNS